MAANLKRLICRRFGGSTNFILFVVLTILVFILYNKYQQTLMNDTETNSLIDEQIDQLMKHQLKDGKIDIKDENFIEDINKYYTNKTRPPFVSYDAECDIKKVCASDMVPFRIVSGEKIDVLPMICFNGKLLMGARIKDKKVGRGVNIVVLDPVSFEVKLKENYDTFREDAHFYRTINSLQEGDIILIASHDEMTNGLRKTSISLMENFGSVKFNKLKYRNTYVFIGQCGLESSKAIEKVGSTIIKKGEDFFKSVEISGCTKIPMGTIKPIVKPYIEISNGDEIALGSFSLNCGMRVECNLDSFPVHLYTGKDQDDTLKICVNGRYIMTKGINSAGRGINIVVTDGREIIQTAHFDTYEQDSTNLEVFLEGLYDGSIVIAVTFDEASTRLSPLARNLFFEIGSGLIQNLRSRDAWYLIGRKGINGFSPIEEISYSSADNAHAPPLDIRLCVNEKFQGVKIRADPLPNRNEKRQAFCRKFDGYGDFCGTDNYDRPIEPAPIINRTLESHPVFNTPILIIGGMSHNSLRMTLETVIMQPGIKPELVFVCIDEKLYEHVNLVDLFSFNSVLLKSSFNYSEIFHKSFAQIWSNNKMDESKQSVIVIEENLILAPDFLYFFSMVYDSFINDPNVAAISSWNPNGYAEIEGNSNYVYRTNEFPGLGFMIKRSIYEDYIENKVEQCCSERAWNNWSLQDDKNETVIFDVIMPDVSRVYHRPYDISKADFSYLENLFNRKRNTNL
jgi:hypothetical protein